MQNLLKNKLFMIFVFIFCLFAFSSFSNVYAKEDLTLPELPSNLSDNDSYIIYKGGSGTIWLDCLTRTFEFRQKIDNGFQFYINGEADRTFYKYDPTSSSSWVLDGTVHNPGVQTVNCSPADLLYFNNVNNSSSLSNYINYNVVFQVAPQTPEEVDKVELMKPTQVQEIPQQIVAVVMIVLPIFLGIFGVLLVLYLIKSKNLLQL